jgi:hypothetical protein
MFLEMTISGATALVGPWQIFQFRNPIQCRQDSLDGGSARRKVARYLHAGQHKHKQTYFPRVGFEPTTPVFEGAKTVPP